ncbi:MAG: glycosyl hydrolase family 5 [Ferruginibacter sp.]|nr:glycosyl hydrolase family 5 [Ferruginibacter sp.]
MRFYLSLFLLLSGPAIFAQGFLKANGTKLEHGSNKNVLLRGMGLGGWMLQEPYMLQLSGYSPAQYDIRKKISALVGKPKTADFYEAWLNNHCTKADIDSLASWGFNSVRLPMHFNLYTLPVEKEPVAGKQTWLNKGFALTDSLLKWCKANKIYLILDLHATPGGQGNDVAIADRDSTLPSLWDSRANQVKTIALWKKLATRYAKEEWIGGYDLINEPNWGFENKDDKNGAAEKTNIPLKKLLQEITAAIRTVDKHHLIFIEGNCWANNFNGIFPLWDKNMAISFHKYWNYTDDASIRGFIEQREKFNVPVWMGETGENSNTWFTGAVQLFERNNIGWCMWPLKKTGLNNPLQVKINPGYQAILDYWKGKGNKPSATDATTALMQFARDTKNENNIVHLDVADAMIRQVQLDAALPFKQNRVSNDVILFGSDYDIGRSGMAYHDKDSAEYWVATTKRTPWNTGGLYRNDGVDIEKCMDKISNGYNVGWIQDGEWLQYTVFAENASAYDVNVRFAAVHDGATVQLLLNDQPAGDQLSLNATGDYQTWKTASIKNIPLVKGWNRLRLLAVRGGFNLNYLQFTVPGATAQHQPATEKK